MAEFWSHDVPMRWADLDALNHVNNVTYVDYASESMLTLAADGRIPDEPPTHVTVKFVAPTHLSHTPIKVVSSRDGDTLLQEIRSETDGRLLNAEIRSSWHDAVPGDVPDGASELDPIVLRRADVGQDGQVTIVKIFELLQESRVRLMATHLQRLKVGSFVVGTVAARIHRPIHGRAEPLTGRGWVSRVGQGSVSMEVVLDDGAESLVSATAVLVGFDLASQTSRPFDPDERAALAAAVVS